MYFPAAHGQTRDPTPGPCRLKPCVLMSVAVCNISLSELAIQDRTRDRAHDTAQGKTQDKAQDPDRLRKD